MSEEVEEEQTDPHIPLPGARPAAPPEAPPPSALSEPVLMGQDPLPPPPLPPSRRPFPTASAERIAFASAVLPARAPPPSAPPPTRMRASSGPPRGAVAMPIAAIAKERAALDRGGGTRISTFPTRSTSPTGSETPSRPPLAPTRDSRPPPPIRRDSRPPPGMPKPSDPVPATGELTPPQRHRLAQIEALLEEARGTVARQRNELDELRMRMDHKEQRLDALIASLEGVPSDAHLEARLAETEARRAAETRELNDRVERATRGADASEGRLKRLEARLAELEEGAEAVRIRMRLERVGHQLQHIEVRAEGMEERIEELRRAEERAEENAKSLARVRSLLDELADEVRGEREDGDLAGLRRRIDDVEALVVKSGEQLDARRAEVDGQLARLGPLSERLDARASDADVLDGFADRLDGFAGRLEGFVGRLESLETEAREHGALAARLGRQEAQGEALASELVREAQAQADRALRDEAELTLRIAAVETAGLARAAELASRISELEALVRGVEERAASLPPPSHMQDDLTRIKGIGPKFARLLLDAGVTSFAQIAAWDEAEVARVAAALGIAPSRVASAGWVERAREILR